MNMLFRALVKFVCVMSLFGLAHGSSTLMLVDLVKSAESIEIVNIERGSETGRKVFLYEVSKSRTIAGKDNGHDYCMRSGNALKVGGTYLIAHQSPSKVDHAEPGCKTQFDDTDARSLALEVIQKRNGSYFVVYSDIDVAYPQLESVELIRQCDLRKERTDFVAKGKAVACGTYAKATVLGSVVPLADFVEYILVVRGSADRR